MRGKIYVIIIGNLNVMVKKKIRQQYDGKITSNTVNIKIPILSQKYKQDGH
jgi:hypothetical protein